MERDVLVTQLDAEQWPCANPYCWQVESKSHAHHGVLRRVKGVPADALWDPWNIVLAHMQCHVPEAPHFQLHSAVILSVRAYTLIEGGPWTIIGWIKGLEEMYQARAISIPKNIAFVDHYWNAQSLWACEACGQYTVHAIDGLPVTKPMQKGMPTICWRCLERLPFVP